jgi:hypothetical protein
MWVMPQSSFPLPPWPLPGPVGGGGEELGCGMQPHPVHGAVGAAVVGGVAGGRQASCSEPGKQLTGVVGPVGIGNGTPGGGVVVAVGRWQTGSAESGVQFPPVGSGSGGAGAGGAAPGVGAAVAVSASVPPSSRTRLTTISAGARRRVVRGSHRARRPACGMLLAGGASNSRVLAAAARGWVGAWTPTGRTAGAADVRGRVGLVADITAPRRCP